MEIAALLALGLQDWIDFGVIVGILLLNAFVGFYQEKQAADVVASLKGDIAMRCTVIRDGREQEILARELVPGDIVSDCGTLTRFSHSCSQLRFSHIPPYWQTFANTFTIDHCSRGRHGSCGFSPSL